MRLSFCVSFTLTAVPVIFLMRPVPGGIPTPPIPPVCGNKKLHHNPTVLYTSGYEYVKAL